jgi:acetyl-CoA carboxylase carboxyltransferase component
MKTKFEMSNSTEESPTVFDAFYAAAHMLVDAVIPPAQTRSTLTLALQIIEQQRLNPAPEVATAVLRM